MRIDPNTILENLAEWFMQLFFDPVYFLKPCTDVDPLNVGRTVKNDNEALIKIPSALFFKELFMRLHYLEQLYKKYSITLIIERYRNIIWANVNFITEWLSDRMEKGDITELLYNKKSIFSY